MDGQSLQSLVWLLIWGVLFFIMMRFGCGAHIGGHGGHGRHRHGDNHDAPGGGPAKDPVCGMSVDPQNAAAAAVHGGKTYYFCSTSCRDKIEKAPEKFHG